jgi:hypothetical protein
MAAKKKDDDLKLDSHFLIFMTKDQKERVKAKCDRLGVSVSKIVRDFFDLFLNEPS